MKKTQLPMWRVKFSTIISLVILLFVCSLEFISLSFENELWFKIVVLSLLIGCFFLMGWSFGVFDKHMEVNFPSSKHFVHKYKIVPCKNRTIKFKEIEQGLLERRFISIQNDYIKNCQLYYKLLHSSIELFCVVCIDKVSSTNVDFFKGLVISSIAQYNNNADIKRKYCSILILSDSSGKTVEKILVDCGINEITMDESRMMIIGHLNPKSGCIHISPSPTVGYFVWKRKAHTIIKLFS